MSYSNTATVVAFQLKEVIMDNLKRLNRESILDYWIGFLALVILVISILLDFRFFSSKIACVLVILTCIITFTMVFYFFADAKNLENEINRLKTLQKIPCQFSEIPSKGPKNLLDEDLRRRFLYGPVLLKRCSEDDATKPVVIRYELKYENGIVIVQKDISFAESEKIFDFSEL